MRRRGQNAIILMIASLLATGLCVTATYAADNHGFTIDSGYPSLNNTLHNRTLPNASIQGTCGDNPPPIPVVHFELNQTSLPGPRYMAFGPSVIALAIDPRLLAVLIAIGAIIAGVWYLLFHYGDDDNAE